MSIERVKRLLKDKENIRLEFKEAKIALPKSLFETICAMLNREGGDIILGANDDGMITGIEASEIESMTKDLVNLSNNAQKLDPPFILFPQTYEIDGHWLIHIQVPASSQIHKSVNIVFDRSHDGDFKVTQANQIAQIYNRKNSYFTEGIIYSALRFEDFNEALFPKIRNLIRSQNYNHPWLTLSDKQLLETAGLWKHDFQSGKEGYTLAAALLLGKDTVIQQILPHYKIDALVRIQDLYRYDDRAYIQTNLIDAYEELMAFVAKHLPDKFYMEGDQRVSLRNKIFREIVANLIVHREYVNAQPCSFTIYADRVEVINANNPHGSGVIDPNNFSPFTKNPTIAKFFIQLGRGDELGSGVINVNRLIKSYAKVGEVQFIEGEVFKTIIPLDSKLGRELPENINEVDTVNDTVAGVIAGVITGVTTGVIQKLTLIVDKIQLNEGLKTNNIANLTNIPPRSLDKYIKQLRDASIIEFKGSPKTGGYYLTGNIKNKIENESKYIKYRK
jgi:ATP-dependent DNA helicase RecG